MCFGEQALINNKPRMATVKCLEDCYFGVMSREDYKQSIGKIQKRQIDLKVSFLKSCP